MGSSSLDRRLWSLFKKGVFEGALNISGALQFDGNLRVAYTSVTGTALYINKAANTGPTIKAHCHQLAASSALVTDQVVANEFKGEFLDTIGTMDGIASHFHLNASSAGIMRAILGVAYLDAGKTLSGADYKTGSWLVGGLFSANAGGILNGAGVVVAGLYGGISSCVGSTLTAAKYIASIWADSNRLVALSSGVSTLILATNQAGAVAITYGLRIETANLITTGISINGNTTTGIEIQGVTGVGLKIDRAANTGGTMKIHCHQLAAVADDVYANEFKGEFLNTGVYVMDGIAAHFHMAASNAGVMRSILGVAYLDTGATLSGALSTGSWIVGGQFSANVAGVINGTAVHVLGAYAGLGSMVGGTLTVCEHMAALMVDSQVTQVPLAGESELLYLHNGLGGTLGQVMYINANDRISEFAHFVNCATMISAKTDADVAYAHYRKLLVTVDGLPGWIYIEMAA